MGSAKQANNINKSLGKFSGHFHSVNTEINVRQWAETTHPVRRELVPWSVGLQCFKQGSVYARIRTTIEWSVGNQSGKGIERQQKVPYCLCAPQKGSSPAACSPPPHGRWRSLGDRHLGKGWWPHATMTCVFVRVLAVGFLGPGRHFGLVFMGCTLGGSIKAVCGVLIVPTGVCAWASVSTWHCF